MSIVMQLQDVAESTRLGHFLARFGLGRSCTGGAEWRG